MKTKYAVSLGLDCAMAGVLKDCKMRTFSGPFDWLDNADIKVRAELIKNNFKDFLNATDLKEIKKTDDTQKAFNRYINVRTGLCFHHDFMKNKSFEEGYQEVKEKYNRRTREISFFVLDRKGVVSKSDILSAFGTFLQQVIIISGTPEVDPVSYKMIKYQNNIKHYFINNTPVDFSSSFQKFKGNIPMISKIIMENCQSESFFLRKKYKLWKWLDKKMAKVEKKSRMDCCDRFFFYLWEILKKDLYFTKYISNRKNVLDRHESLLNIRM